MIDTYSILLCFVSVALIILMFYILRKDKKPITYAFLGIIISCAVCCLGYVLAIQDDLSGNPSIKFSYIAFFGEFFAPVFFLISGIIFAKGELKQNYKYWSIILIPIISNVLLWTNDYHHLFFANYNSFSDITYGPYFYTIHLLMMYGCMFGGIYYYIKFSIKNAGFFSKQAIVIVIGAVIPLLFNISWVVGNAVNNNMLKFNINYDILPVTFSIMTLLYWFAIFKLDFLNVIPIALQRVVDCISDSFVIVNTNFELIDYNKSFKDKIMKNNEVLRKASIFDVLDKRGLLAENEAKELENLIKSAVESKKTVIPEKDIEKLDRIFNMEITPIFSEKRCLGIIILFKDITELKKSQNAMIEQERLASLGQLAGGMAHDINTPIATIRMGLDFFTGKHSYTEQEEKMLSAMKISASKITEIVESVRNQIRNTGESQKTEFLLDNIIDNIKILVNNELEKNRCKLLVEVEEGISLYGDFGKLSQVVMNIVLNAIQAYSGESGEINVKGYIEENQAIISVKDMAGGIPKKIAEGLFKEILTTKGTKGTGFGLYFAKSMVRAEFNGDILFETEEGKGTIFYIKIPMKREEK